ncbi:MAG: hypothetical protein QXT81_06580, partial [Candidatus Bathyarchaeia archaeon]
MKRVWKPSFLTAFLSVLLLAPALFQFDIQSAQAQNITIDSVEVYPEIVALEQTFTAVVNGRYEVTGGVGHALEVGIKNTLGEWVGGPSRYVIGGAEGLSTVRGEWQLTFEVAGLEYNGDEMGNCEVMSTPEGNLLRRRLFAYIVSPDTVFPFESKVNTGDPYVTIRDFLVIPHGGRRGDPIYAGEMVQAHIMVSVSPGGHWERVSGSMGWLWGLGSWELDPCRLVIRFRNTPDMAPTNLGCWDVGSWDGHRSYAYGEVIRHSLNLDLGFDIQAPDRPTDNWEWVFEARAEAEDTVRDEESFTIQVLERETNRIWIDDVVVVPDIAEPSQNLRVNIQGGYAFLEGETHNIILTVQNEYRREVRQLRDISGGGSFSEILNAVAPSTEGENIRLGVARAVIQGTDIDDEKEFYVTVRSGAAAERYCRITGVTVNGQTPPQQVTLGEDFTVGVTAEWSLPPEAERVHVGIAIPFEEGLILSITIVGDDLDPSVSPASISFNIDGSSLREILSRHDLPQGGRLGLQAFISYWVGHVQEAGE